MNRLFHYSFAMILCLAALQGCAGSRTSRTETVVTTTAAPQETAGNRGYVYEEGRFAPQTVERTTEVREDRSSTGSRGILSSTIHAIGWVIALPFRLIGGLIGWIF